MRVANEQSKEDLSLKCEDSCKLCEYDKPCRKIELYAADLLEARDLIKEMRGLLNDVVSDVWKIQRGRVSMILEKSKDYA